MAVVTMITFVAVTMIAVVHSQDIPDTTSAFITTDMVTTNATYVCHCETYVMNNYTNSEGTGCISGDDICATCNDPTDDTMCTCAKSSECELINDIVKALAVAVVVLIV